MTISASPGHPVDTVPGLTRACQCSGYADIVIAYIVIAYIVMACIVVACIGMACLVVAYIVMALYSYVTVVRMLS